MANEQFSPALRDRDLGFLRGAGDVLSNYELKRTDLDDEVTEVKVGLGKRSYTVRLLRDWSAPPTCTCPDSARGAASKRKLYCKHTIAVALRWDEFRCQLLDLMI